MLSDSIMDNEAHIEEMRDAIRAARSIGCDACPADLTGALAFFSFAESNFVAGQTLAVCRGSVNT